MLNLKQMEIMRNILYAVETGGQVYGCKEYGNYTEARANCSNEKALTIGAGAFYSGNARSLLRKILYKFPGTFRTLDCVGIEQDLQHSWKSYDPGKGSLKARCIQKIITTPGGIQCQDEMMDESITDYVNAAEKLGVTEQPALMMCANIHHLGGSGALKRIISKTKKPYTINNIFSAMKTDQLDDSSENQVGDHLFWSRHEKVYQWIKEKTVGEMKDVLNLAFSEIGYVEKSSADQLDSKKENRGMNNFTKYARDVNSWGLMGCQGRPWCATFQFWLEAKVFGVDTALKHFHMSKKSYRAYSVFDTEQAFPKHKRSKNPVIGSLVVFTFSHIGRVVSVGKGTFDTIEGNTSSNKYDRNGGMVQKKTYRIGDPKIKCFLIIDYGEAPVISVADSQIRKGQQWLSNHYGEKIVQYTGKKLDPDGEYGPHSRAAALCVWKDLTNRRYGENLDPKNSNFFGSCKKAVHEITRTSASGTYVFLAQFILAGKGFYSGEIDCEFGSDTAAAVKSFQKHKRIDPDGEIGADTWFYLFN